MKWRGRRGSRNIEDRRSGGGAAAAGGIGGLGLLAVIAVGWVFGVDLTPLLDQRDAPPSVPREQSAADREAAEFVSVVLADTEEVWADIFVRQLGRTYEPVTLVLFSGVTQSPCGNASGATGPFYCPADEKAYLDTDFFATLAQRLGAGGDFAAAYVVAHEVAHHVQHELGVLAWAHELRRRGPSAEANGISVRVELQADCYAGLWAAAARDRFGSLERGDVAEAMNAAAQIGDDRLAERAGRVARPHTYTHGTSEQRQRWFLTGYESGDIHACDTFSTDRL